MLSAKRKIRKPHDAAAEQIVSQENDVFDAFLTVSTIYLGSYFIFLKWHILVSVSIW